MFTFFTLITHLLKLSYKPPLSFLIETLRILSLLQQFLGEMRVKYYLNELYITPQMIYYSNTSTDIDWGTRICQMWKKTKLDGFLSTSTDKRNENFPPCYRPQVSV